MRKLALEACVICVSIWRWVWRMGWSEWTRIIPQNHIAIISMRRVHEHLRTSFWKWKVLTKAFEHVAISSLLWLKLKQHVIYHSRIPTPNNTQNMVVFAVFCLSTNQSWTVMDRPFVQAMAVMEPQDTSLQAELSSDTIWFWCRIWPCTRRWWLPGSRTRTTTFVTRQSGEPGCRL